MKKINYSKIGIVVAALSFWVVSAGAQTRMSRVMWTDRTVTNPPLSHQTSIDDSIERFWNLPDEPRSTKPNSVERSKRYNVSSVPEQKGVTMEQRREVRERRGFVGINLFNLIPLIDIVHGEVTTESLDRVKGKK